MNNDSETYQKADLKETMQSDYILLMSLYMLFYVILQHPMQVAKILGQMNKYIPTVMKHIHMCALYIRLNCCMTDA